MAKQSAAHVTAEEKATRTVLFDGRKENVFVEIAVNMYPNARKFEIENVGKCLRSGSVIGSANGKNVIMNYFVHETAGVKLDSFVGRKVIGSPVVCKKTLPDGREYLHVDIHPAIEARPTHSIVAKAKDISAGWWDAHYKRQPGGTDIVFTLPEPVEAGLLAIMSGQPVI